MSEYYKTLTVNCDDLKSTWNTLLRHFEGRAAADKLSAKRQLELITLTNSNDIHKFLNEIRLTRNTLASCGSPIDDESLFLIVMEKLPASMKTLKDMLLYGPPDRRKFDVAEQTLLEYNKNNKGFKPPEHANIFHKDTNLRKCTHCKKNGHVYNECRARNNKCKTCGQIGHFERRCKNKNKIKNPHNSNTKTQEEHSVNYAFSAISCDASDWTIDTGASSSVTPTSVSNVVECEGESLTMANGKTIPVAGRGSVDVGFQLSNVLLVPQASRSLLSIGKACDDGNIDGAWLNKRACYLYKGNEIAAVAPRTSDGLYHLYTKEHHQALVSAKTINLWHERLAHAPERLILDIVEREAGTGIAIKPKPTSAQQLCEACETGKATRLPFKSRDPDRRASEPGRVLHLDICGPMQNKSAQGSSYVMPITDEYSRFITVYFLETRSQAPSLILQCIDLYKAQYGYSVKIIQTDNAAELTSSYLKKKLLERGIQLQTSVPYTPEQNGLAERVNRTLIDRARTMLLHAGLEKSYWKFAVACAAHVTNRIPSSANNGRSPYELFRGQIPNLDHMRVFGCRAYAHIPDAKRQKLDAKAKICTFLGYAMTQKGYLMRDDAPGKLL